MVTSILIGLIIFGIIYFVFIKNKAPSNDMKKYKKAVRQSKAKYKKDNSHLTKSTKITNQKKTNLIKKNRTKRSAAHLKVIDGNKTKRKDRASL